MSDSRKMAFWTILIGGLIAALYGQFLHNPIVFDDLYFFMLDNDGHSAIEKFASPQLFDLRALPYATLAWTANLFGFGLPPFRIGNLLLHWSVTVALALFVIALYRKVMPFNVPDSERTGMLVAILISLSLFALHPLSVYAAGYLVQRSIVMATLFSVLSLWAFLRGGRAWLWISVILYLLATHCKEHVIMLPVVIVALTVLVNDDWKRFLKQNWPVFVGYALVGLLTVAQIRGVLGHAYEINAEEMLGGVLPEHALFYSILTQTGLFFKYGILWLLPNPAWLSVDMREPFATSVFSGYGVVLLAYIAYGVVAIRLLFKRGKLGLVGFAMLFPWLMFATEFTSVRIQEIFVLYRSYIWALGGVIVLPLLLMQLNARLTIMVSVLFAATLFMVSMERLMTFSHPILLWEDAAKLVNDRPAVTGAGRIYYNRGTEWLNLGDYDKAIADLQLATKLTQKMSAAFGNLGVVYLKTGQNELAIQAFSRAIALDQEQKADTNYKYYYGRAKAYEANGLWREAAVDFQVSCLLTGKMGCDKNSRSAPLKNNQR
jgi:hypothetical protein